MNKLFSCIAFILLSGFYVFGQIGELIPQDAFRYQTLIRDRNGQIIANELIAFRISILEGNMSGSSVYIEVDTVRTNSFGLVNLSIGDLNPVKGDFQDINWSEAKHFIRVEMATLGRNYELLGNSQLLSVPYAIHAKTAKKISGITYAVGDFAQGGVIFWLDSSLQHGLVCSIEEVSGIDGSQWYNGLEFYAKAMRRGIYGGEKNTERITDAQGMGDYAAFLCAEYQGGEYGDWYLPAIGELGLMFQQKDHIDSTSLKNGGSPFQSDIYWSSTEDAFNFVMVQDFLLGFQFTDVKFSLNRIRAIRSF